MNGGIQARRKQLNFWISIIIIFAAIMGYFNVPEVLTQKILGVIILGPLIGIITSYVVALYVEALTGNLLKEEYLCIKDFFGYDFSITVFTIVTAILEIVIFST